MKTVKTPKLGRYEKILARADKKRPMYVEEVIEDVFLKNYPNAMVLDIKVLLPTSSTIRISWSEKTADNSAKAGS